MGRIPHKPAVGEQIASAIRRQWGANGRPAADAARATGIPQRTIEAWLEGRQAPRADALIALCWHSDELWSVFCEMAGRKGIFSDKKRAELIRLLTED